MDALRSTAFSTATGARTHGCVLPHRGASSGRYSSNLVAPLHAGPPVAQAGIPRPSRSNSGASRRHRLSSAPRPIRGKITAAAAKASNAFHPQTIGTRRTRLAAMRAVAASTQSRNCGRTSWLEPSLVRESGPRYGLRGASEKSDSNRPRCWRFTRRLPGPTATGSRWTRERLAQGVSSLHAARPAPRGSRKRLAAQPRR